MRGAGVGQVGDAITTLELAEAPEPESDELLIEVAAAGVGNWDDIVRTGGWDVGSTPPMALGVEAAGTVVDKGGDVDGFAEGDAVLTHPLPLRNQGTWAERLIAPASLVAKKPENVSWAAAAVFPVPALTAEQVLTEALRLSDGEWILVHGAGGVTGGLLVQLAAARGARVLATASPDSADRVRGFGAEAVWDYRDPQWSNYLREHTNSSGGVPAAVNAARGEEQISFGAVADGGRFATITGDPPAAERGINVSNIYVRPDGEQLRSLAKLLGDGQIIVPVARTYALEDAAAGLAAVVGGSLGGGVALTTR